MLVGLRAIIFPILIKSKVNCNSNSIYFLFLLANIAPSNKAKSQEPLLAALLLVAMPFAPSSVLAPSFVYFLFRKAQLRRPRASDASTTPSGLSGDRESVDTETTTKTTETTNDRFFMKREDRDQEGGLLEASRRFGVVFIGSRTTPQMGSRT